MVVLNLTWKGMRNKKIKLTKVPIAVQSIFSAVNFYKNYFLDKIYEGFNILFIFKR